MESLYDIVLQEVIKRKRDTIPSVVLLGARFTEYMYGSEYTVFSAVRTILEPNKFIFDTGYYINFDDYKKELIYLKIFTKKIYQTVHTKWKDLIRSTVIIKIHDMNDKVFYMYIKLGIKGYCNSCDGDNITDYRIVYSSSFDDLVTFIYKPKQIPDFLSSEAFISVDDKTIDQCTIIKNYNETSIKKINYDTTITNHNEPYEQKIINNNIIIVDLKNHTLTTKIEDNIFLTKYKVKKDEWFVNEIITKGSNTISVRVYYNIYGVDICISNDIEILKKFELRKK